MSENKCSQESLARVWIPQGACACATLGVLLALIGVVTQFILFPAGLQLAVYKNLELVPDSEGWRIWYTPPVPVYMKFTLFHVENPDEISLGGKPRLTERGPYAYREVREKENLFLQNDDTMYYDQKITYYFDEEETHRSGCVNGVGTPCSDTDEVTVLNAALVGLVFFIQENPVLSANQQVILLALNRLISSDLCYDTLFHENVIVKEVLFEGYTRGLLDCLDFLFDLVFEELGLERPDLTFPLMIMGGKFAVFNGKNGTSDNYRINTGKNDMSKYTKISHFRGKTKLPDYWWPYVAPTPRENDTGVPGICHDISGTDGLTYQPFIEKDTELWLFVSDLCRSIWVKFDEEVELRGIDLYRFRAGKEVFDMRNNYNFCYCPEFNECTKRLNESVKSDAWDPIDCFPLNCKNGVLKAYGCQEHTPVVLTAPHFFQTYVDLAISVDGMYPDRDLHDTIIDLHPDTGLAMSIHKRLQVNVELAQSNLVTAIHDLRDRLLLPYVWVDEGSEIDDYNEKLFKDMYEQPIRLVEAFVYGICYGFGALAFFGAVLFDCYLRCTRPRAEERYEKIYH